MDRILRPTGFIIVRDKRQVVEFIKKYLKQLHWEPMGEVKAEPNTDSQDDEVVFLIQKQMWAVE